MAKKLVADSARNAEPRAQEAKTSRTPPVAHWLKSAAMGGGPLGQGISAYPLPPPLLVREGWGVILLSILILLIPGMALSAICNLLVHQLSVALLGIPTFVNSLQLHITVGLLLAMLPAQLLVYAATSRFVIDSVLELERQGKVPLARQLALAHQRLVWFRHWKRSPGFQKFTATQGLCDEDTRYARFLSRARAPRLG